MNIPDWLPGLLCIDVVAWVLGAAYVWVEVPFHDNAPTERRRVAWLRIASLLFGWLVGIPVCLGLVTWWTYSALAPTFEAARPVPKPRALPDPARLPPHAGQVSVTDAARGQVSTASDEPEGRGAKR